MTTEAGWQGGVAARQEGEVATGELALDGEGRAGRVGEAVEGLLRSTGKNG